jgi:hypothetical protein
MAMADSAHSKLAAPEDTMLRDRFFGVLGTSGIKAALLTDKQAQGQLVKSDQFYEDGFQHG